MTRHTPLLFASLLPLACGPGSNTADPGSTGDPTTTASETTATTSPDVPTTTTPTTTESTTTDDTPTTDDTGPAPLCVVTGLSDLPGVNILFPEQDCVFTLAEAAAGLEFSYEVVIDAPLADVTPFHSDAGGCDSPGPSGLITFPTVSGGDENYCLCDQGLCPGTVETIALAPGTFPDTFAWTGVNWGGPSDTNNPKGPPFPPGNYLVTIIAQGTVGPEGEPQPFQVQATLAITLVP